MNIYVKSTPSEYLFDLPPEEIDPAEFIVEAIDEPMRRAISESLKGRKLSESHKQSLSRAMKGRHGRPITIDGVTYNTIKEASRVTGIPESTIRGRRDRALNSL